LTASRPHSRARAAFCGAIAAAAAVGLARAALMVITVDGESMAPTYRSSDAVLIARRWIAGPIRPGHVVVCRLPPEVAGPGGYIVKRVTSVISGQIYIRGDAEHSYDSRAFGTISLDYVLGRVIARLTPSHRVTSAPGGADQRQPESAA
jgi:signal peptidase I